MLSRSFAGFDIVVENPKGSVRQWYDRDARLIGQTEMLNDYGFLDGHIGVDGDEVDCYLGDHEDAPFVFVIHQLARPDYDRHDEDKIIIGGRDEVDARNIFKNHRDDGLKAYGGMSAIPVEKFREKLERRTGTGKIRHEADFIGGFEFEIIKRPDGYHVLSENGKHLGGPYDSRVKAEERLRQVEIHKHMDRGDSVQFGGTVAFDVGEVQGGRVRTGLWDRICVPGENIKDGEKTEFTAETCSQMVENFGDRGDSIMIDWNHQSSYAHSNGQPAPALGFYGALVAVFNGKVVAAKYANGVGPISPPATLDDGLWGLRTEVTPKGHELLPGFRFVSPTFTPEGINQLGEPIGYALLAVAATNTPWQAGTRITFECSQAFGVDSPGWNIETATHAELVEAAERFKVPGASPAMSETDLRRKLRDWSGSNRGAKGFAQAFGAYGDVKVGDTVEGNGADGYFEGKVLDTFRASDAEYIKVQTIAGPRNFKKSDAKVRGYQAFDNGFKRGDKVAYRDTLGKEQTGTVEESTGMVVWVHTDGVFGSNGFSPLQLRKTEHGVTMGAAEDDKAAGVLGARWNQMKREGWRAVAWPPGQSVSDSAALGPLPGGKVQQLRDTGIDLVKMDAQAFAGGLREGGDVIDTVSGRRGYVKQLGPDRSLVEFVEDVSGKPRTVYLPNAELKAMERGGVDMANRSFQLGSSVTVNGKAGHVAAVYSDENPPEVKIQFSDGTSAIVKVADLVVTRYQAFGLLPGHHIHTDDGREGQVVDVYRDGAMGVEVAIVRESSGQEFKIPVRKVIRTMETTMAIPGEVSPGDYVKDKYGNWARVEAVTGDSIQTVQSNGATWSSQHSQIAEVSKSRPAGFETTMGLGSTHDITKGDYVKDRAGKWIYVTHSSPDCVYGTDSAEKEVKIEREDIAEHVRAKPLDFSVSIFGLADQFTKGQRVRVASGLWQGKSGVVAGAGTLRGEDNVLVFIDGDPPGNASEIKASDLVKMEAGGAVSMTWTAGTKVRTQDGKKGVLVEDEVQHPGFNRSNTAKIKWDDGKTTETATLFLYRDFEGFSGAVSMDLVSDLIAQTERGAEMVKRDFPRWTSQIDQMIRELKSSPSAGHARAVISTLKDLAEGHDYQRGGVNRLLGVNMILRGAGLVSMATGLKVGDRVSYPGMKDEGTVTEVRPSDGNNNNITFKGDKGTHYVNESHLLKMDNGLTAASRGNAITMGRGKFPEGSKVRKTSPGGHSGEIGTVAHRGGFDDSFVRWSDGSESTVDDKDLEPVSMERGATTMATVVDADGMESSGAVSMASTDEIIRLAENLKRTNPAHAGWIDHKLNMLRQFPGKADDILEDLRSLATQKSPPVSMAGDMDHAGFVQKMKALDFSVDMSISRGEVESGLRGDEESLKKAEDALARMKGGEKLPNWSIDGAERQIQGLKSAIENKRNMLRSMERNSRSTAATRGKGARNMSIANAARVVGLEPTANPKDVRRAFVRHFEDEAKKAAMEEQYNYDDAANHLEDMAKAYEDAKFEEEEGADPGETPHVVMRKMATHFRKLAKMGDPPFGGKETPSEEAAEEAAKGKMEDGDATAAMAARLGLPARSSLRQISMAMDAKTVSLDKVGHLEKRLAQMEAERATEIRNERVRAAFLTFEQAVAQGRTKPEKRDVFVSSYQRNPKEAEGLLFAPGTFASKEIVMSRMTSGGAPLGIDPREGGAPAVDQRHVTMAALGGAKAIVFGENLQGVVTAMADSEDPKVKARIDRELPEGVKGTKFESYERYMAADRIIRKERPDLVRAADQSL